MHGQGVVEEAVRVAARHVARCQVATRHEQLAGLAGQRGPEVLVQQVHQGVVQRPADGHLVQPLHVPGAAQHVERHVAHHLGGAVEIAQAVAVQAHGREVREELLGQRGGQRLPGAHPQAEAAQQLRTRR